MPVPPPRPAVTNTMSAPSSASMIFSESSSAARRPTSGFAPAPSPLVSFTPSCSFTGGLRQLQRLAVGVGGDELHALHAGGDHAIDGVAAAAAHADDFDLRAARNFVVILNADFFGLIHRHRSSVLLGFFRALAFNLRRRNNYD